MFSRRMNIGIRAFIFVWILFFLSSCGQKSPGLQEGAISPDQMLFENGMKYMDKGQLIKARLTFQTLISSYPEGENTPDAFFAIVYRQLRRGPRPSARRRRDRLKRCGMARREAKCSTG